MALDYRTLNLQIALEAAESTDDAKGGKGVAMFVIRRTSYRLTGIHSAIQNTCRPPPSVRTQDVTVCLVEGSQESVFDSEGGGRTPTGSPASVLPTSTKANKTGWADIIAPFSIATALVRALVGSGEEGTKNIVFP